MAKNKTPSKTAPKDDEKAPRSEKPTFRWVTIDVLKSNDGKPTNELVEIAQKAAKGAGLPAKDDAYWQKRLSGCRAFCRKNGLGDFSAVRSEKEAPAPAPKGKAKKVAKLAKNAPAADYEEA